MVFLVLEIIIFLVLALMLGTLVGYMLSRSTVRDVRTSVEQLKLDVAANRKRLSGAETDLQLHKSSLSELRAAYDGLQERLSVHSDRQADLSGQMEGLVAARSALSERTANLASQLTESQAGLGRQLEVIQQTLSHRLDGLEGESDSFIKRLDQVALNSAAATADESLQLAAVGSLTDRLSSIEERANLAAHDAANAASQLLTLSALSEAGEERLNRISARLDALQEADEILASRVEEVSGRAHRLSALDDHHLDLEARLRGLEALQAQLDASRGQFERIQSAMTALTARLEHQDRWGQETDDRIEALEGQQVDGAPTPVAIAVEERPPAAPEVTAEAQAAPTEAPAAVHDNLKRIRGVGLAAEKTLNNAGIVRFDQIAAWAPQDIENLSGPLEKFQARIVRDDWVTQAKALIEDDKNGTKPSRTRKQKTAAPQPTV